MLTMHTSPVSKYIFAWLALPLVAVFNGVLRDLTYQHAFGDQIAHQVSSVLLSLVIILFVVLINSRIRLRNAAEAWAVGLVWMILTILFEFGLGAVNHLSWSEQLKQYDISSGNLWLLVVVTVFCAPALFRRFGAPGSDTHRGNYDKYHLHR